MGESLLQRAVKRVGPGGVLKAIPEALHERLRYEWRAWARPEQLPPDGMWRLWLILAGRGFGKTRTGAEFVIDSIMNGGCRRFALVARTAADARDIMIQGEAGILDCSPPWFRPVYSSARRRLTWPNGAIATVYSDEVPDQLRGPAHDGAWVDELAKFRHLMPKGDSELGTWGNLQMGLRLGRERGHTPRTVVTTTPRPIPTIKQLNKDPNAVVVRGHTDENEENLTESFKRTVIERYRGTRAGRQELAAELLEDVEGALWKQVDIDERRIAVDELPDLERIVTAIDPSGSDDEGASEQGIVTAGRALCRCNGGEAEMHFYVLSDDSGRMTPNDWASRAVRAYHLYGADRIIGESNYGGAMVESTVRQVDSTVAYKAVSASRGKVIRAEPIAALSEQRRVHFVGEFDQLEDQLTTWTPKASYSPDRLDAYVWAITELANTRRQWRGAA